MSEASPHLFFQENARELAFHCFGAKSGKETLVKDVARAIPTFAMSCFDPTKTFCQELNTLIGKKIVESLGQGKYDALPEVG